MKRDDITCAHNIWCLFLGLMAVVVASPAAAHSELRGSVPASGEELECAPDHIALEFNQSVQLTALRLYQVGGDEIALPRRSIREASSENIDLPPLTPGEFRAEWRIISADGHPVGGTITFGVTRECQQ